MWIAFQGVDSIPFNLDDRLASFIFFNSLPHLVLTFSSTCQPVESSNKRWKADEGHVFSNVLSGGSKLQIHGAPSSSPFSLHLWDDWKEVLCTFRAVRCCLRFSLHLSQQAVIIIAEEGSNAHVLSWVYFSSAVTVQRLLPESLRRATAPKGKLLINDCAQSRHIPRGWEELWTSPWLLLPSTTHPPGKLLMFSVAVSLHKPEARITPFFPQSEMWL